MNDANALNFCSFVVKTTAHLMVQMFFFQELKYFSKTSSNSTFHEILNNTLTCDKVYKILKKCAHI